MPRLVLASTSPYRRQLLERLGLAFDVVSPGVDETPGEHEDPEALADRLARAKARAGASSDPCAVVVGSDQVAVLGGERLDKPGTPERAVAQLVRASGRSVRFLTGVCVLDSAGDRIWHEVVPFEVTFRRLRREHLERYVAREHALDCAGGFRAEGLGVALFSRMHGEDPTALLGLPLIRLCDLLARAGLDPLGP